MIIRLSIIFVVVIGVVFIANQGRYENRTPEIMPTSNPLSTENQLALMLAVQNGSEWQTDTQRLYVDLSYARNDDAPLRVFLGNGGQPRSSDLIYFRTHAEQALHAENITLARQLLESILMVNAQDTVAHYQLGLTWLTEDHEKASFHLSNAVIDPRFRDTSEQLMLILNDPPEDIYALVQVLVNAEEWQVAARLLSAQIQETPLDYFAYAYRGYVLSQQGKNPIPDFEVALGLAPDNPLPYYFLGLHWRDDNRLDDAILAFSEAYSLDPTNAGLAFDVAQIFYQNADFDEAAEWFDIAISLDSTNETWHEQRAAFYAETQYNLEQVGIRLIQVSWSLFPENPHILASLGYANYWLGYYDVAAGQLAQAIDMATGSPRSYYFLGQVMQSRGDRIAAIEAYSAAMRIADDADPYFVLAERALRGMGVTP